MKILVPQKKPKPVGLVPAVSRNTAISVHFSSAAGEWATPQDFYDAYHATHNFTLDPCCTNENAKCVRHYTQAENGLKQDWSKDRVWMNPPYGREIGIWMRKAYEESLRGALVVCLVPARTDTAWWHDFATKGEVTFVRGRLKFSGHKNSAPFPSAVVVLKPRSRSPQAAKQTGSQVAINVSRSSHAQRSEGHTLNEKHVA